MNQSLFEFRTAARHHQAKSQYELVRASLEWIEKAM